MPRHTWCQQSCDHLATTNPSVQCGPGGASGGRGGCRQDHVL